MKSVEPAPNWTFVFGGLLAYLIGYLPLRERTSVIKLTSVKEHPYSKHHLLIHIIVLSPCLHVTKTHLPFYG